MKKFGIIPIFLFFTLLWPGPAFPGWFDDFVITNLTGDVTSSGVATDITESVLGVGGTDTVFPADPNADRYLKWDDTAGALTWATIAGGGDLLADASVPMTSDWDIGNYDITLKALTGDGTIEGATLTEGGVGVPNVNDFAKDLVATSPLTVNTGANVDDIIYGADADVTIAVVILKDLVTTAPITGGANDVFLGTDADLTIGIDVLKDLVTTAPVTGGTNDIFPGADADITVALDFTAAWNFGGASDFEIANDAAPTTNVAGEIALDTTITDHQPLLQYYDGAENMTVIAVDTAELPALDNEIVKYNAASDKFVLEADAGAGGAAEINVLFKPQQAKLPAANYAVIDASASGWKLLFDDTTQETASWEFVLDDDYGAGTLYCDVYFSMASGEADEVQFEAYVMAVTAGTDDADWDTDSYDTENVGVTTVAATAGRPYKQTITLTNDDSLAAGDMIRIKISTDSDDAVNDDATGDREFRYAVIRE